MPEQEPTRESNERGPKHAFYGRFGTSERPTFKAGKWKGNSFKESGRWDLSGELQHTLDSFHAHKEAIQFLILVKSEGVFHVSLLHYRSQDGTGRPDTGTSIEWTPKTDEESFLNIVPKKLERLGITQRDIPLDEIASEAEEFMKNAQQTKRAEHLLGDHSIVFIRKIVEMAHASGIGLSFSSQNDLNYLSSEVIQIKLLFPK